MFLGIIIIICSFIGIAYGVIRENRTLLIASIITLIIIASIGLYFLTTLIKELV